MSVPKRMAAAATAFLDALDDDQRAQATAPFEDEAARRDWHYVPRSRRGASLSILTSRQRQLAFRLLVTALSTSAYAAATSIMALEEVLDELEGQTRGRHRDDYDVVVLGEPDGPGPWTWRFEGHHLSVTATVVGDEVACTPSFFGANPAYVGPIAPVAPEHALGLELARALGDGLDEARLEGEVPEDILTTNAPVLDGSVEPAGVRIQDAGSRAGAVAIELVRTYVGRLAKELQAAAWDDVERQWGDVRFAWAGPVEQRARSYYRVQGPDLLIELDNTTGNHLHTVWRSRRGDFGDDLLRRHRSEHH